MRSAVMSKKLVADRSIVALRRAHDRHHTVTKRCHHGRSPDKRGHRMHIMPASGVSQNAPRLAQLNADAEAPSPRSGRAAATPPIKRESIAEHDPTLLVAALEAIESKRMAIESLLEAGLLWRCLT